MYSDRQREILLLIPVTLLTPFCFPLQERPASDSWQKLEKSRDYKNNNQLREYQLEGMNWLLFNWYNRRVADGSVGETR